MPELPEVETMRRGILEIEGSRVEKIEWLPCRFKPILTAPAKHLFRRRAVGQRIIKVDRVGKRLVLRLEKGDSLVIEPRMTGLVLLADPPDREHLRLRLQLSAGPKKNIWYWDRRGLGSVRLLSERAFEKALGPSKLGPDALDISSQDLADRLSSSRREIKVALLDQRALAGIGNLYAAEILHLAAIHPQARCDHLKPSQWLSLHQAMQEILNQAIAYEGSTLSDGTYRNALNQAGSFQSQHRIYDRAGEICTSCGAGTVLRIVQAQRSTFFCPACQVRRPLRRKTKSMRRRQSGTV
jgi:formamidopyrimidine-DNA glycosylase